MAAWNSHPMKLSPLRRQRIRQGFRLPLLYKNSWVSKRNLRRDGLKSLSSTVWRSRLPISSTVGLADRDLHRPSVIDQLRNRAVREFLFHHHPWMLFCDQQPVLLGAVALVDAVHNSHRLERAGRNDCGLGLSDLNC